MISRLLALGLAALAAASPAVAQDGDAHVAQGKRLFMDEGCFGCHTVVGIGTPIAVDLSRIGAKYSGNYLERWLEDPSLQKPSAHMPKINLGPAEVRALAAYLASLR